MLMLGVILGLALGSCFGFLLGVVLYDLGMPHRRPRRIYIRATDADGLVVCERAVESARELSWN